MRTNRPQPCNVLLIALVSSALHAGTAVLFFPVLSFLMLCWGTSPVQFRSIVATADDGMVFAVLAPFFFGIFGFFAGGLFAWVHNFLAKPQPHVVVEVKKPERAPRAASISNVA
jgi:hypothetical protein